MDWNHLNNFERGQPRIIPVKFRQNPNSGLGGDVVWRNCLRMHRWKDDRQRIKPTTSRSQSRCSTTEALCRYTDYINGEQMSKWDFVFECYESGPEVIKCFSCSGQLSMKFALLISLKLLTIANSFSANRYENANYRENFMLNWPEHEKHFITLGPFFKLNSAEHEICTAY